MSDVIVGRDLGHGACLIRSEGAWEMRFIEIVARDLPRFRLVVRFSRFACARNAIDTRKIICEGGARERERQRAREIRLAINAFTAEEVGGVL